MLLAPPPSEKLELECGIVAPPPAQAGKYHLPELLARGQARRLLASGLHELIHQHGDDKLEENHERYDRKDARVSDGQPARVHAPARGAARRLIIQPRTLRVLHPAIQEQLGLEPPGFIIQQALGQRQPRPCHGV